MVSTFTPNIQIEEPARGDDVGVWDTPVNANMTLIDLVLGAINTISLNNSPVVLSAAQFQSASLTFNSTLTASVAITFPTSFKKPYHVYNNCTGSSAFIVTLATTVAGGQAVALPPGQPVTVWNDGTNLRFVNFGGPIGSYWDYCGSSVPNWNDGCTIKPYLNADGGAVSSATHPVLFGLIGATLPDQRGRARIALDQGVGRVSSAVSGLAGNTILSGGGSQAPTIGSSHLPAHNHPVSDPGHTHTHNATINSQGNASGGSINAVPPSPATINSAFTGLTVSNSTYANAAFTVIQPTLVGGLTLIRSA